MQNSGGHQARQSEAKMNSAVVIPLSIVTMVTAAIMSIGFGLVILLAVVFNFKATTATHCRVPNYLPSISAAIAKPPSSYVWRFIIIVTAVQRFAAVRFHYLQYARMASKWSLYSAFCKICFLCELVENLALVGLTCVSSTENTGIHENMFVTFQVCSMVFMLLMCIVYRSSIGSSRQTPWEKRSFQVKLLMFAINILSFVIAIYFYFRHNMYCEPGVYSLFAFFEYLVVLSNIAFHASVTYDFGDRLFMFGAVMEHTKQ